MDYKNLYIELWKIQLRIVNRETNVSDTEAELWRSLDKATDTIWHYLITEDEQKEINEVFKE